MKFKAFLTDNGVALLEKRFLPALDKMGRVCHLYLTRENAMFLHNLLNGDGVQSIAQFRKESLFDDYRISSQNDDRIAFLVDLGLLHRALRSSVNISIQGAGATTGGAAASSNRLQIKLVKKKAPNSRQPMPFLTFETKGYKSAVIQDVPISNPLSKTDVMELQSTLDMAQNLPQTLVQIPDLLQLQNLADRLKQVGDLLNVSITQYGDLHLQVSTTLITVGSEFRKLGVLGVQVEAPAGDQVLSAQSRREVALHKGEALSVHVNMKHFTKTLHCHFAKPDCAFYGIAPQGACLTVIFQFFIPGTWQIDKSISLHCRLPDDGFNNVSIDHCTCKILSDFQPIVPLLYAVKWMKGDTISIPSFTHFAGRTLVEPVQETRLELEKRRPTLQSNMYFACGDNVAIYIKAQEANWMAHVPKIMNKLVLVWTTETKPA
ncbi:hypothetical protein NE237_020471 [Protea cynaroides]|uniref:Checkpoint protein n=1 Tax=Protea cynaroides TaxID=273540 RepID=A0A9Q0H608_9MAGN|nr:hypothetical protein NE237_020471 [Protea cynaroides]